MYITVMKRGGQTWYLEDFKGATLAHKSQDQAQHMFTEERAAELIDAAIAAGYNPKQYEFEIWEVK